MKTTLCTLIVTVVVLGGAGAPRAADPKQFNCEKAVVVELPKMARAQGKCLATCVDKEQAKPTVFDCTRDDFSEPPLTLDLTTLTCVNKAADKYSTAIVKKCTGYMPTCGGYLQGWCNTNTSVACNNDSECGLAGVGYCRGRCTTSLATCTDNAGCPMGQTCDQAPTTKTVGVFATDNRAEIGAQVQATSTKLFQCRQKVCSVSGALCSIESVATDCGPGESCSSGKCSTGGALCDYNGDCASKTCLPLGRCALAATSCVTDADCGANAPCRRHGRCSNKQTCFDDADCPVGTCTRTAVDGLGPMGPSLRPRTRDVELKCTKAVTAALAKLTYTMAGCQAACAKLRDAVLPKPRCTNDTLIKCATDDDCEGDCRPISCDPYAVGRCSVTKNQVCADVSDCPGGEACDDTTPDPIEGKLKACRQKAFDKAVAAINKKCPSLPDCGMYSQFGLPLGNRPTPELLLDFVTGSQDPQFKEDNPDLGAGSNFCAE